MDDRIKLKLETRRFSPKETEWILEMAKTDGIDRAIEWVEEGRIAHRLDQMLNVLVCIMFGIFFMAMSMTR